MERPIAWKQYDEASLKALEDISARYRVWLDQGKTERECVTETVEIAKAAGYQDLNDAIRAAEVPEAMDTVSGATMSSTVARQLYAAVLKAAREGNTETVVIDIT